MSHRTARPLTAAEIVEQLAARRRRHEAAVRILKLAERAHAAEQRGDVEEAFAIAGDAVVEFGERSWQEASTFVAREQAKREERREAHRRAAERKARAERLWTS